NKESDDKGSNGKEFLDSEDCYSIYKQDDELSEEVMEESVLLFDESYKDYLVRSVIDKFSLKKEITLSVLKKVDASK
ncbi:16303_t:CDS:2, partial [Funneliformis caledonium]